MTLLRIEHHAVLEAVVLLVQVQSRIPCVMFSMAKLKIQERKLKRELAYGLYHHGENLIEIEPRMKPKHYLSVLVHELLHHTFPNMSESMVTRSAPKIAKGIWQQDYRRLAKYQTCKCNKRHVTQTSTQ